MNSRARQLPIALLEPILKRPSRAQDQIRIIGLHRRAALADQFERKLIGSFDGDLIIEIDRLKERAQFVITILAGSADIEQPVDLSVCACLYSHEQCSLFLI